MPTTKTQYVTQQEFIWRRKVNILNKSARGTAGGGGDEVTNKEAVRTLEANYPDACFEQLREAVDAAIEALTKEAWKEEHPVSPLLQSSKQDADDTISRKQAIDAILAVTGNSSVRELYEHVQEHGLSDMWSGGVNAAIDIIIAVPPVQPEKRTEERTETHACDLIDRQAAIDAVKKNTFRLTFAEEQNCEGHVAWSAEAVYSDVMEGALLELPSAQPEIIRCKDCKYNSNTCGNYVNCDIIPQMFGRTVDNFCSMAERRTDD